MLNINGVLYKSTSNKLQKSTSVPLATSGIQNSSERSVFVRGEKFLLDRSGTRLRRDSKSDDSKMNMSRIDIGGLTYKKDESGEFERDNSHKVRSHLRYLNFSKTSILKEFKGLRFKFHELRTIHFSILAPPNRDLLTFWLIK